MNQRPIRYILIALLLLPLFQACDSEDPSVNASRLRIKLTDAASLVIKEFQVNIREVAVLLVDSASNEGEWVTLDYVESSFDILKLRNGKTVQIVDQYVPAGTVLQQVRLLFGNDNQLKTNTDSIIQLSIPAELEEGLIIDAIEMEMRLNTISSMIIDLNAALSVVTTPQGENFLYPVARAFPEVYGGRLRGYIAPLEANPHAVVIQENDTLYAVPELEGGNNQMVMFQFLGLKEGDWDVHLIPNPATGFRDTVITVTIEQGKPFEMSPKPIRLKRLAEE